ncbi:MAG: maleylpyruvate isomerase family mycothiol-dependent enzyme [Pseudoclavibacter sp.]|nr:maleylpyruvate isomerase family mycothiol-dependent enzyme [Pseudoclavibacter sp.]
MRRSPRSSDASFRGRASTAGAVRDAPNRARSRKETGAALRDRQLDRLCDALAAVPAEAPTCCEGWSAHDLAVHLWQLHRDPLAWALLPAPRLSARRLERLRRTMPYRELIVRLRGLRGPVSCMMPMDALEGYRHALGEYFVHTQDVVRANGLPQIAADDALEEALWRRAGVASGLLRRGCVLEHPDGRRRRSGLRPRRLVRGRPAELICWVYGRPAEVEVRRLPPASESAPSMAP